MSSFLDPVHSAKILSDIESKVGRPVESLIQDLFSGIVGADQGLIRLFRLLEHTSQPAAIISQLEQVPQCGRFLASLLSVSPQLSDVLTQNPELTDVILSPDVLAEPFDSESVIEEGRRLIQHTSSYAHQLDRLRFVKQKYILRVAVLDLAGVLPQPEIWKRLSDLAKGVLTLAMEVAWQQFRQRFGGGQECPVFVICMGKFGGKELNYSSDIDLIFVTQDDVDPEIEQKLVKYSEMLRACLADRMGRGDLYRVDLRLRPFGSQGPIMTKMSALEAYYERYSEPWEHLAMIRSEVVGGRTEDIARWAELRGRIVFGKPRGVWVLENLSSVRQRAEDLGGGLDLKRGPGGIRDVEFLVQTLQMLHGKSFPDLQGAGTVDMLALLNSHGLVPSGAAMELKDGYEFLRKLEHRCQIIDGLQTHKLPTEEWQLKVISASMGSESLLGLQTELAFHRQRIRYWYELAYETESRPQSSRTETGWLHGLPGAELFEKSLHSNATSLERVELVLRQAPALVPVLKKSVALSEQVLTGEIEEQFDSSALFSQLHANSRPEEMAELMLSAWSRTCLRWLVAKDEDLGTMLQRNIDDFLNYTVMKIPGVRSVLAYGTYASGELSPASDADIVVFAVEGDSRFGVEKELKSFVQNLSKARAAGMPLAIDFRLRPEGRDGRMAVSLTQFKKYEKESMELWERFALGRSRFLKSDPELESVVNRATYGKPLDDLELAELLKMKKRIENERVSDKIRSRHLKLGNGGLDDIVWLVQLWLMRHPFAIESRVGVGLVSRIEALVSANLLSIFEGESLREGFAFLQNLRARMFLLGIGDDVFPENPDKLNQVAETLNMKDANVLLAEYKRITLANRRMFEDNLKRMQS